MRRVLHDRLVRFESRLQQAFTQVDEYVSCSFRFASAIDASAISADLADGVLTVRIPKAPAVPIDVR